MRDLANKFQIKVELRQIGPRDEAKLIGGFGRCGLQLCCHNMLTEFDPVSIKMAKVQNLPLNPMKISGTCGRLLCCLTYEHQIYRELKAELPREGSSVTVAAGTGKVTATHPLKGTVTLMLENRAMVEVTAADINAPGAARPGAPPRAPAGAPVTGRPVRPPAEQKAPPGEVSATDQKATADGTATDSGAPRPERRRRRGGRGGGGRDNRPRGGPGRRSP